MERPLVIYHANCPDGFGAAVAAYCHFRQGDDCPCDFVAASFGQPPPEVTGRQVYIVDFSYPRPVLKSMCRLAQAVTILDHHVTAVLTWEFFHRTPPPQLLLHIQDRDLWRCEMEGTNDVYAALLARPFDFRDWAGLIDGGELPASLFVEGEAINRYRREMIAMHRNKAVIGSIDGCRVPVVNCYDEISSDLLGELAIDHPFAAGYQDQGTLRKWSLRSSATGADVAEIARRFGGGGHQHASGFTTRLPEGLLHICSQEPVKD